MVKTVYKSIQHVIPRKDNKWSVKKNSASRTTKIYNTQEEAIKRATELAKKQLGELVVHGKNGMVVHNESYAET